jgi:DNA polymerase-3 subunit alpha (Gram-positive type)
LKLKDVICCREDIMLYLIARNVQPAIAFKISEKVRKGQGKDVINEYGELLKEKGIPQ